MELDRTQNVAKANSNTSSSTSASTSASTKGSSGTTSEASRNMVLSDAQFRTLISGLSVRQEVKSTFSNCTARFHGNRNSTNVEDFLATILVYKEAENISDFLALTSLPLLLEGYASSWWQGVKDEAKTFNDAVDLLRGAFAPPNQIGEYSVRLRKKNKSCLRLQTVSFVESDDFSHNYQKNFQKILCLT